MHAEDWRIILVMCVRDLVQY